MPITSATTLVADAPGVAPPVQNALSVATLPGTSTANTTMVDDAAPLTSSSLAARSGPNRVSFGTMLGHEMHGVQARVAAAVAESDAGIGVRGTAHGRDVHLPAHPAMAVEPENALAATSSSPSLGVPAAAHAEPAAASTSSDKFAPARDSLNEFSGGDHNFFSTEPINDEYEPENPRGRLYTRLAVSGAVVAVVSVVVVAWVNSHGSSGEEPPPIEVKSQPAVTAPAPLRTAAAAPVPARPAASTNGPAPAAARPAEVPPTTTIPSSIPERIAVTTAPPRPAKPATVAPTLAPPAPTLPPRPAPIAAAAAKPAPVAAPAPKPAPVAAAPAPVKELRTPPPPPQKKPTAVAAAAPHPPAAPAPHAATPPPPPAPAARPAAPVAKVSRPESAPSRPVAKSTPARASKPSPARGKQKYDPDGTLPLSFE